MQAFIYLYFNGDCDAAMSFYQEALGGEIKDVSHYGDAPGQWTDADKKRVMHATLHTCGTTIHFSDCPTDRPTKFGDNFAVTLGFESEQETDEAFTLISGGGTITMPLQDMFWGAKFGMCTDKFGVHWMFNFDRPKA